MSPFESKSIVQSWPLPIVETSTFSAARGLPEASNLRSSFALLSLTQMLPA